MREKSEYVDGTNLSEEFSITVLNHVLQSMTLKYDIEVSTVTYKSFILSYYEFYCFSVFIFLTRIFLWASSPR